MNTNEYFLQQLQKRIEGMSYEDQLGIAFAIPKWEGFPIDSVCGVLAKKVIDGAIVSAQTMAEGRYIKDAIKVINVIFYS
jgi:hypothetical protein